MGSFVPFISPEVLMPTARILLIGGFGIALVRLIREGEDLTPAFEALAVGFLALLFFPSLFEETLHLTQLLSDEIGKLGNPRGLEESVRNGLITTAVVAGTASPSSVFTYGSISKVQSLVEHVWRSGVWGVMTVITEWFFLLCTFLIEKSREVIWQLIFFLMPLACGFYPIFPRLLTNLLLYSVEVALWLPVLVLVRVTTSHAASDGLFQQGSLGLPIVAVELIAIVLMLAVPSITHRITSAALSTDLGAGSAVISALKKALAVTGGILR